MIYIWGVLALVISYYLVKYFIKITWVISKFIYRASLELKNGGSIGSSKEVNELPKPRLGAIGSSKEVNEFPKPPLGAIGYLYVPECSRGILSDASEDKTLKNMSPGPPWIVVHHEISAISVAKWPGTLWEAQVIDEARNTGLRDWAKYTRANEVKIIRKLPVNVLFGDHGQGILKIIDTINLLDLDSIRTLSNIYSSEASALYSKGWNIFAGTLDENSSTYGQDHRNTIAMPGCEGHSPINNGFGVIYDKVFNLARELTKGEDNCLDNDGGVLMDKELQKACDTFLFAAMAIAYQHKFSESEVAVLTKAWEEVYD